MSFGFRRISSGKRRCSPQRSFPKFEHQLFKIKDDDYHLYLIPTSETVLNGLHIDEIFSDEELPKSYVAYTPCFRREAGAAGSQERGLIRMHQFNKVEMFAFTLPDQAEAMFQQMIASAEEILQGLNMHYRNMLLGHRRHVVCCDEDGRCRSVASRPKSVLRSLLHF